MVVPLSGERKQTEYVTDSVSPRQSEDPAAQHVTRLLIVLPLLSITRTFHALSHPQTPRANTHTTDGDEIFSHTIHFPLLCSLKHTHTRWLGFNLSCRLSHRGRPHHQSKEARSEHQFNDMPRSESFIFFQKTSPLLIVEKTSFISHLCSISYGFRHSAGIFLANSGRSRRRGPSTGSRFWTCRGPSPQTPGQEPKSIYAILSTFIPEPTHSCLFATLSFRHHLSS